MSLFETKKRKINLKMTANSNGYDLNFLIKLPDLSIYTVNQLFLS